MDDEECTVDNIVEKLTDKLSGYIESLSTVDLERLLFSCKIGSLDWFQNSIASVVSIYSEKELEERNIKNE
jgi:hypothetical protein